MTPRHTRGDQLPQDMNEAEAAQRARNEKPKKPEVTEQATLDPKLSDPEKTPGSGMFDDEGGAASG